MMGLSRKALERDLIAISPKFSNERNPHRAYLCRNCSRSTWLNCQLLEDVHPRLSALLRLAAPRYPMRLPWLLKSWGSQFTRVMAFRNARRWLRSTAPAHVARAPLDALCPANR